LKQQKKGLSVSRSAKTRDGKIRPLASRAITVSLEEGRLFVQENDEPKQELVPETPQDFYSATSSDEYAFTPAEGNAAAQLMVLHADGKDFSLKHQD
jgi:hypothetical protein